MVAAVFLIALLKLFRVPRVYHLHNKGVREFQKNNFNRLLYKFVFKNSEVILLSKYLCPNKNIEMFSKLAYSVFEQIIKEYHQFEIVLPQS